MNRRNFIRSGSLAILAVSTLPKAVRSMNKATATSLYRTKSDPTATMQTLYEITVTHSGIDNFDNATEEDKIIWLKVAHFDSTDLTKPTTQGQFKYIIKNSKKGDDNVWTITTKFDSKISGDYSFEKGFPANLKLHCTEYTSMEILDKKGKNVLQTLQYTTPASTTTSAGGCFITTACVQHQQLADDCDELTTLRQLRDNFMRPTAEGEKLIAQYQVAGPAVVAAINSCDNSAAIYDHMYTRMILPAVQLVKTGKQQQAVAYYKAFVQALVKEYV